MALQIRRGDESQRQAVTFLDGEPAWVKDTQQLYMGQNSILGGILVGGKTAHVLAWQPSTLYTESEIVIYGEFDTKNIYRCQESHTSGVFDTDLGTGKWLQLSVSNYLESFIEADWVAVDSSPVIPSERVYKLNIAHSLNQGACVTTVYENDQIVLLNKVSIVDANNVELESTQPFNGVVLVSC